MQRTGGQAAKQPAVDDTLPLEAMVRAYASMIVAKQRLIAESGDQPLNVGELLGSILDAEVLRGSFDKATFKRSARTYETSKSQDCSEFQRLKLQYDDREGLAVTKKERAPKPPPKVLTEDEKKDTAVNALRYCLEEGKAGSCALDRRCGSLFLSAITNYSQFQPHLQQLAHGITERSKLCNPEQKKAFRSFIQNPTRHALNALPDVVLEPSCLRLSALIAADHVTDVNGMAALEQCAAYVESASCVAMALDVEKSPLSCTWKQLKPALIQIADSDRVFLLHCDMLSSSAEAASIANRIFDALLGRGRTLVVFGADDLSMLRKLDFLSLPAAPLCSIADMQKMCLTSPSLTAQAGVKRGLADWVAVKWHGSVMSKTWTLSGWDMPSPLLEGQLEYAALDAVVTFALWRHCSSEKDAASKGQ